LWCMIKDYRQNETEMMLQVNAYQGLVKQPAMRIKFHVR
jgi:hypothetical protein